MCLSRRVRGPPLATPGHGRIATLGARIDTDADAPRNVGSWPRGTTGMGLCGFHTQNLTNQSSVASRSPSTASS